MHGGPAQRKRARRARKERNAEKTLTSAIPTPRRPPDLSHAHAALPTPPRRPPSPCHRAARRLPPPPRARTCRSRSLYPTTSSHAAVAASDLCVAAVYSPAPRLLRRPRFVAVARRPWPHSRVIPHPYISARRLAISRSPRRFLQNEELLSFLGSSVGIEKLFGQPPLQPSTAREDRAGAEVGRRGASRRSARPSLPPCSHLLLSRRLPLLFRTGRAQAVGGTDEGDEDLR